MNKTKTTLLMGGIPVREFKEYFAAIGGQTQDDSVFAGEGWQVSLNSFLSPLGPFMVERTEIIFEIDAAYSAEMLKAFRLAFLRAGG